MGFILLLLMALLPLIGLSVGTKASLQNSFFGTLICFLALLVVDFNKVKPNDTEPTKIEIVHGSTVVDRILKKKQSEIRTFKELGEAFKKASEQQLKDREAIQVERQIENFSENWAKELSDMVDKVSGQELETNSEEQSNQLEAEDTSITETYIYSDEFEKLIEVFSQEKIKEYSLEEKDELFMSMLTIESLKKMKFEELEYIKSQYFRIKETESIKSQSNDLQRIGDWVWDSFKELMRVLIGFGAALFLIRITLDSRKSGSELIKERLGIEEPTEHKEPEIVLSPLEQKIQERSEMLIED